MNKKTVKYIFFFFMLLVLFTNISTTHAFETIYDDFETTEAEWAGWTNVAGDSLFGNYGKQYDKEWEIRDGRTPSYYTGPDQASTGSKYIYLEASGSNNKTVYLEAVHLEAGTIIESIEFNYHMYGRNMGTLDLEYYDSIDENDGNWISVWNQTGQKQNSDIAPWEKVNIDLSAYKTNKVRFKGVTGKTYTSDIALDNITITTISNDNPLPVPLTELNRLKGYVAAQDIYLNSYKISNEPDSASLAITSEKIEISKAMKLQPMNNAPADPSMGDIYVNISNALCVYMDGKWNKVTGTGTCGSDTTAPVLLTIEVPSDGGPIILTYNESLDDSVLPSNSDFLISSSSNVPINVTDIDIDGPTVTLTLDRIIEGDETLALNYAAGAAPIQDSAGNDAALIDETQSITNSSEQDTIAPVLQTVSVPAAGTTIELTYDENLDTSSIPDNSDFTISGSALSASIISVTIDGNKVTLTLDKTIFKDEIITLTYTVPANNPIQDPAGNDAALIDETQSVINNSTALGIISGISSAGPIQNGVVTAYLDLSKSTVIGAPTLTNSDGSYRIPASDEYLNANLVPDGTPLFIYIEITGRYDPNHLTLPSTNSGAGPASDDDRTFYIDEAINLPVYSNSGDVVLRAATHITYEDKERKIAVTPLTDLSFRMAQARATKEGEEATIEDTITVDGTSIPIIEYTNNAVPIELQLGEQLDIIRTLPGDIKQDAAFHGTRGEENSKLYGEALTALSQLQKDGIDSAGTDDLASGSSVEELLTYLNYDIQNTQNSDNQINDKLRSETIAAFKQAVTDFNEENDDSANGKSEALVTVTGDITTIGTKKLVVPNTPITLDGTSSNAMDGDSIENSDDTINGTFFWELTKPDGSQASLTNADTLNPSFTTDARGQYVAMLNYTDDEGNSSTDYLTITVPKKKISGIVSAGSPIVNGVIKAYTSEDKTNQIEHTLSTTDSSGSYAIYYDGYYDFIYVEATESSVSPAYYIDQITGSMVTPYNDTGSTITELRAATTITTADTTIHLTPITELAVRIAEKLIADAGSGTIKDNIVDANTKASQQFIGGTDTDGTTTPDDATDNVICIITTAPADVTKEISKDAPCSERLYGMALAGISKTINNTNNSSYDTNNADYNEYYLYNFLNDFDNITDNALPPAQGIQFLTGVSKFYQSLKNESGNNKEASTIAARIGELNGYGSIFGHGINSFMTASNNNPVFGEIVGIKVKIINADGDPVESSLNSNVVLQVNNGRSDHLKFYNEASQAISPFYLPTNSQKQILMPYSQNGTGEYFVYIQDNSWAATDNLIEYNHNNIYASIGGTAVSGSSRAGNHVWVGGYIQQRLFINFHDNTTDWHGRILGQ